MSSKPIRDLRRRMIEDMSVRNFGEKTQTDYIRHVERFVTFLGRSPETATGEDLRRYQVHLRASGVQPPTMNSSTVALRFFFTTTLGLGNLGQQLTRVDYPRKLPRVLSPEEVGRLLEAAPGPGLKYKRVIYGLLFKASAEVMQTIAADPKHLDAKIAITSVLHTWGSAMTHHPHVHMIVPGGGLSEDRKRWIPCRKGFFLPVRILSKLFRGLMLEKLVAVHAAGQLNFYGVHAHLGDDRAFKKFLRPLQRRKWFVYAKRPFAGPRAVLAYLSRYTHRVAISNNRLIKADEAGVTFRIKDYRRNGPDRYTAMTLSLTEFIRRFLIHVLPKGLHRIRHYGLFASGMKAANLARMRELLGAVEPADDTIEDAEKATPPDDETAQPCPCCGGVMRIIEIFAAGCTPHLVATPEGIDSS